MDNHLASDPGHNYGLRNIHNEGTIFMENMYWCPAAR